MILVDAGPLVAAWDVDDRHHESCTRAIASARTPRYVPGTVVAEVCHLVAAKAGTDAEAHFLDAMGSGYLTPIDLTPGDYARSAELVRQYRSLKLGGVDASLVALAERLGITELVTIDVRHFSVVIPRHAPSFTLIPGS